MLNCGHPVTRSLVVAALRHWAAEYRVEGFVFNNAENLTQVCVLEDAVCMCWEARGAACGRWDSGAGDEVATANAVGGLRSGIPCRYTDTK